jgi:hypothetical protein
MFEPLMVFGLFGAIVWVITQAIFILIHGDGRVQESFPAHDTLTDFVEENYGTHFVSGTPLGAEGLRRR